MAVRAGGGGDHVRGGLGGDILRGGQGADLIQGGGGADTLLGGAGNDRFVLSAPDAAGMRLVRGDAGNDTLFLRLDAATASEPDVQAELARLQAALALEPGAAITSTLLGLDLAGVERLVVAPQILTAAPMERAAKPTLGLRIRGEAPGDLAGYAVAGVGDVNGDGRDDILIGARNNEVDRFVANSGAAYVVFGRKAGGMIDLGEIAGGDGGFKIQGYRPGEAAGASVSGAGDLNGDGLADVIVGVPSNRGGDETFPGGAYVVFGKADGDTVRLSDIARDGSGGFLIRGEARFNQAGVAVGRAGDVNGDGLDDLLIGAPAAPGAIGATGAAYVVLGKADGAQVRLFDIAKGGGGGFKIAGADADDRAGVAVAAAGDLNGDELGDFLVGAERDGPSGAAYLVFGRSDLGTVDLAAIGQGIGGTKIVGAAIGDFAGAALAAGDVNGDGQADVILGAAGFDGKGILNSGAVYVVFGSDWSAPVDLTAVGSGQGGFRIVGEALFDNAGIAVAAAGDLNGDGRMDLLIGADRQDRGRALDAGAAYVVFGKADGAEVDLAAVGAGQGGFKLTGALADDAAGFAVAAAGDVNSDGLADLLIGAPFADNANGIDAGTAYVLFGRAEWLLG